MTRLQQHKLKQTFQKLIIIVILVIAGFIFFFNIGIKLLISTSLFINQLANSKPKQQTKSEQQALNSISIDPIPSATNSSTLVYSGTSLNFDRLEVYINNEKTDEIDISDIFTGEINGLEKGSNTVAFIAKSTKTKETKKTQEFSIIYKESKPKLEIKDPQDNAKTNKEDVVINGSTDNETTIRINDTPVIVDAAGNFSGSVRLKNGENKISITAEDIAGNIETKTLTISYSKDD